MLRQWHRLRGMLRVVGWRFRMQIVCRSKECREESGNVHAEEEQDMDAPGAALALLVAGQGSGVTGGAAGGGGHDRQRGAGGREPPHLEGAGDTDSAWRAE